MDSQICLICRVYVTVSSKKDKHEKMCDDMIAIHNTTNIFALHLINLSTSNIRCVVSVCRAFHGFNFVKSRKCSDLTRVEQP